MRPDNGCFVASWGWIHCRARTRPSGRQLFCGRRELRSLPDAHWSIQMAAGVAWHLFLWRALLRVVRAVQLCGTRWPLSLGTCPCALVVASGLALWRGSWPRVVRAPRPVRWLSVLQLPFPTPWCLSPTQGLLPSDLLGGCARHVEARRELASWCLRLAPAVEGALGLLRVVPVWGPALGLSLAGPFSVRLGLRALRWFTCMDPVTGASGFPYCPSLEGGLRWCTGSVLCARPHPHLSFQVGGRQAWVPCVCACARSSERARAGWPPGRVLVRLTFPLAASFFWLARPPGGWRCPFLVLLFVFLLFFVDSLPSSLCAPAVSCFL